MGLLWRLKKAGLSPATGSYRGNARDASVQQLQRIAFSDMEFT